MLTLRRSITALVFTAFCATPALADSNDSHEVLVTDIMVAQSLYETKADLATTVTHDVLTASYHFEPEAEQSEMVATVSIQDISTDTVKSENNDA